MSSVRIVKIDNKKDFFRTIDEECKGQVYLVTDDGDKLNLKSKLSQYVATLDIFKDDIIGGFNIECTDKNDLKILLTFLMQG